MKITRDFCPGNRYAYDFGLCSYEKGWAQVDAAQDASFFGTWANPARLTLVLDYSNTEPAGEAIAMVDEMPKAAAAPIIGKRQAILDQAQTGELPPAPDFSKPTHARFRAKLAQIVALAEVGDIAALQAFEINPVSSSPKAMARYRDLCVIAITARAEVAA